MRTPTTGFTLLEVLIALVILGITMLGVQATMTDRAIRQSGHDERRTVGHQLLSDQLDHVQSLAINRYGTLADTLESPVAGFPQWTRETRVMPAAGKVNYRTVTVRVWAEGLADTLARTIVVAPS